MAMGEDALWAKPPQILLMALSVQATRSPFC